MPNIIMTREAANAIRGAADPGRLYIDTATPTADGQVSVPLEQSTIDRLTEVAFPGESLSDTIVRIAALKASNGRTN